MMFIIISANGVGSSTNSGSQTNTSQLSTQLIRTQSVMRYCEFMTATECESGILEGGRLSRHITEKLDKSWAVAFDGAASGCAMA